VKLVFFQVACDDQADGATGLQNLKLKKTKKGYTFGDVSTSAVAYTDDTSEDGKVGVAGRFNKNAKAVSGALRVKTDRCGDSGTVKFLATKK
jgi:hypothetical protein